MTENAKGQRAEDVLPPTFHPSPLAGDILRDPEMRRTQLEYIAEGLGEIRLAGDLLAGPIEDEGTRLALAARIGKEATRLQRLVKALAVGALAAMVLTVGLAAGPAAGRAEAMEAPQPDPVAAVSVGVRTVPVVLSARYVTVRVPVTTWHVTPRGYHCSSVWGPTSYGQGFLGRACSLASSFTVPVTLDARYVPLGRSSVRYTDDVAPLDSPVGTAALDVRRPSRFGVGSWTPTYWGDGLTVTAPLYAYTASVGAWTPQQASPVQVQELIGGRWVVRATLTTNRRGIASGPVILGGGLHTVRVARQAGATVWSTVGTARTFYLVPTDVPVDID